MSKIKNILTLAIITTTALFLFTPSLVYAANPAKNAVQCGANSAAGEDCNTTPNTNGNLNNTIQQVVNILTSLVGIVAVVMIIIGGYRYMTSSGDPNRVASAKNTLLYAIIGIIIAVLAQVIVKFVIAKVK
jgi:hypothetical protein